PEVLHKLSSLCPSARVQRFLLYSSAVIFAPTGYPEDILIKKSKEPSPGTLNTGPIRGRKAEPNSLTIPRPMRISMQIKKGRSAGQTTLNHSFKPSREAAKASPGYLIMNNTRIQKIKE
ncbi:MAG TPA: hypothetical protein PLE05_12110, partial [Bacillota bacterium]|nr:hypothetical protein [Bacillota bacterium]